MKRSREEIENTIDVIKANIKVLPYEIILHMISFLEERDVQNLCQTDVDFSQFCRKFNLTIAHKAMMQFRQECPYGEWLATPQAQLDALHRGQNTVYQIHFRKISYVPGFIHVRGIDYLSMGNSDYDDNLKLDGGDDYSKKGHIVSIKGPPPSKGTELWILGVVKAEPANYQSEDRDHKLYPVIGYTKTQFNFYDESIINNFDAIHKQNSPLTLIQHYYDDEIVDEDELVDDDDILRISIDRTKEFYDNMKNSGAIMRSVPNSRDPEYPLLVFRQRIILP